jgi:hypothetical protein
MVPAKPAAFAATFPADLGASCRGCLFYQILFEQHNLVDYAVQLVAYALRQVCVVFSGGSNCLFPSCLVIHRHFLVIRKIG